MPGNHHVSRLRGMNPERQAIHHHDLARGDSRLHTAPFYPIQTNRGEQD